MEETIKTLRLLLEEYKGKKRDEVTSEFKIYYAGGADAISKAIRLLESKWKV
mgnify:CR=1 FL=1